MERVCDQGVVSVPTVNRLCIELDVDQSDNLLPVTGGVYQF